MEIEKILSKSNLHISIKKFLQKNKFDILDVEVSNPAAEKMIGFFGDHFKIRVKVSVDGKIETVSIFVKLLPVSNVEKLKFLTENKFFLKEVFMYEKIFPNCKMANGPIFWKPNLLHITGTAIVMVDLTSQGFSTINDKRSFLNLEHCFATLNSIAKYHSEIMIYEHCRSKELNNPGYTILHEFDLLDEKTHISDCPWFHAGIKASLDFLNAFSTKFNSKMPVWDSILKNIPALFLKACTLLDKSDLYRNVILHADLWTNNLMFKYDNTKVVDVALLDFQFVRYGPYGTDLSSFFYLTTQKELRDKHEKDLLKHYHKTLNETLVLESQELSESFENIGKNFEHCRMFGLVQSIMIFPFINLKDADAKEIFENAETYDYLFNVNRSDVILKTAAVDSLYRERILGNIEEFIERYIL